MRPRRSPRGRGKGRRPGIAPARRPVGAQVLRRHLVGLPSLPRGPGGLQRSRRGATRAARGAERRRGPRIRGAVRGSGGVPAGGRPLERHRRRLRRVELCRPVPHLPRGEGRRAGPGRGRALLDVRPGPPRRLLPPGARRQRRRRRGRLRGGDRPGAGGRPGRRGDVHPAPPYRGPVAPRHRVQLRLGRGGRRGGGHAGPLRGEQGDPGDPAARHAAPRPSSTVWISTEGRSSAGTSIPGGATGGPSATTGSRI